MTDRIDEFVALLERIPGTVVTVDRSHDASRESFIDIRGPGRPHTQVNYRPAVGFGLYEVAHVFGQKPDVLIEDPADAAERLLRGPVLDPSRSGRSGFWQHAKTMLGEDR